MKKSISMAVDVPVQIHSRALFKVLANSSRFATLPHLSLNSPSYAGIPSKNIKVDQNIRMGRAGVGGGVLNLHWKNTTPSPSKTCVVPLVLTVIAHHSFPVLSCLSLEAQEVFHWP